MTLDLRTLGFVVIISITLQTLALVLQWRASRELSGPGWWALGNAGIVGGFIELTRTGQIITNITYDPFFVYGIVAIIYFVICASCSMWGRSLERKYAFRH